MNKKSGEREDKAVDELKLRERELFPSDEVLENALGESFTAFRSLSDALLLHDIVPEWNHYRDGNAWLCKLLYKKRNLGWISVFDGYFNITCYFTEKHLEKIEGSAISQAVKEVFYSAKPSGRLIPMTIPVRDGRLPEDTLIMLLLKKELK